MIKSHGSERLGKRHDVFLGIPQMLKGHWEANLSQIHQEGCLHVRYEIERRTQVNCYRSTERVLNVVKTEGFAVLSG